MASYGTSKRGPSRVLILLCIAAALLVYAAASSPETTPRRVVAGTSASSAVSAPSATPLFSAPELASLTESVERPLFYSGRRPFSPDQPPHVVGVAIQKGEFALIGVSIRPDRRDALFRRNSTGTLTWVGEGDKLEGWIVKAVQADRAILEQGTERDELELWSPDNKATMAPPARANPQRPVNPPPNAMPRVPQPQPQAVPPARQARPAPRTTDRER